MLNHKFNLIPPAFSGLNGNELKLWKSCKGIRYTQRLKEMGFWQIKLTYLSLWC